MALIRIKQINNSPATEGALIAFDGTNNVWTNNDTGAVLVSSGTTAQRPGTPTNGFLRYNTTTNKFEMFQNGVWVNLDSAAIAVEDDTVNVTSALSILDFGTNLAVVDNGGGDITINASSSALTIITTFATLPVSPTLNDTIFYTPFNSVLKWDGADWVGPKITIVIFGREGTGNNNTWLKSVGRSDAFPTGGTTHGVCVPDLDTVDGNDIKITNIAISTINIVSGTMELHANATATPPVFGTTGIVSTTLVSSRSIAVDVTPGVVIGGATIQCFWNRTAGQWKDWTVAITYSFVARA